MTNGKIIRYPAEVKAQTDLLKILAHPTRLMILKYLAESGNSISPNDLRRSLFGRILLNYHLGKLKKAGLIRQVENSSSIRFTWSAKDIHPLLQEVHCFLSGIVGDDLY